MTKDFDQFFLPSSVPTSTPTPVGHKISDMEVTIVEKIFNPDPQFRKQREKMYINKFNTQHKGINRSSGGWKLLIASENFFFYCLFVDNFIMVQYLYHMTKFLYLDLVWCGIPKVFEIYHWQRISLVPFWSGILFLFHIKIQLGTELASVSVDPTTHPHPWKFIST